MGMSKLLQHRLQKHCIKYQVLKCKMQLFVPPHCCNVMYVSEVGLGRSTTGGSNRAATEGYFGLQPTR